MQQIIPPCRELTVMLFVAGVAGTGLVEEKQQTTYALTHTYVCACMYVCLYMNSYRNNSFIPLCILGMFYDIHSISITMLCNEFCSQKIRVSNA